MDPKSFLSVLTRGVPLDPLPQLPARDSSVPHAPKRTPNLNTAERKLAVQNALRYFPERLHAQLAQEFADELSEYGHIYMYRFRPTEYVMKAYPIEAYPAQCRQAASVMLMIMNNLDHAVAQFPDELITYGGNGSVFSNWVQYLLVMKYLSEMREDQTLVMHSGHPLGLFPSHKDAPRVVVTNGLTIPAYTTPIDYDRLYALGVSQYGQMTAGSYCYIGPQGIVHGTTITVLNGARNFLGADDLQGRVYMSSGLGGMSGAQPKAGLIARGISVTAEVDEAALNKRVEQGWVQQVARDIPTLERMVREARHDKVATSIAYHGNVVDLWEHFAEIDEQLIDLGSDQTSLHNPFNGGYYPVGMTVEESNAMMASDPAAFKERVQASLRRQVAAINKLSARGMRFWDYGNAFLLQASKAGAPVLKEGSTTEFIYPSYVENIMGDVFSLGFGPFRWVCCSGSPTDLAETDRIAARVIERLAREAQHDETIPAEFRAKLAQQYRDNLLWVRQADEHKLVVGSQARILYSDERGRRDLALAFNQAIAEGRLSGPVVLSRDHHDVSGADSPFRETSNIRDGSRFCADMATQTCIGDAFRGATWVALHNGGGVGWGQVVNCGFGLVLDGSDDAARRASLMLHWDVNHGVARRSWSQNRNADFALQRAMQREPRLRVTQQSRADPALLDSLSFGQ